MKKIFAIVTSLTVAGMIVAPAPVGAVTAAELQEQINTLMATLADLQTQLADLTGEPTTGGITGCTITSFTRNLKVGMTGDDVKCLQIVLNSASDTQLSAGVGSPGQETSYFGPKTKAAVIKFQEKYTSVTLTPWGLTSGTGYVGSTTRTKLNAILSAEVVTPVCGNGVCETGETATTCPADCETIIPSAAGLSANLAYDTPASATIPVLGNANFTKFTLTAGSEGNVNISKIYVTRSGLSDNNDVENIKIIDVETGAYKGSIGSLNVDNRAMITFVPKLIIPAGTTKAFYIRAGVASGATSNGTVKFSIAAAADIVSDATEVSGSFPIIGNAMTMISLTIGSIIVSENGTTIDSQPDAGDTDVVVLKWKAAAGSTEGVTIETVTVKRVGTADATDTDNIELYDVTAGKSLGVVSNWDSEDKATWNDLGIVITKGKTNRFEIMLDIVAGVESATSNVNVDIVDGTDCTVTVKGNTYGFYITPTSGTAQWATDMRGKGANPQTIQAGALNISKSGSTPATGNVRAGDDIVLGVFDFDARGEDIKITAISVYFVLAAGIGHTDITNIAIYDEDDEIVAGPGVVDYGADNGLSGSEDFTDTFIVPVGIHEYTVKATLADSVSTSQTLKVGIETPTADILTAVGMVSNDEITATPSSTIYANVLTIAAGALTVTTLTSPAARTVPSPSTNYVWATFSFDAGASGEDINVTAITLTDSGAGDNYADVDNSELWADLTSASSSRGDIYETKISQTKQWASGTSGTAQTQAYVLTEILTIPKGSFRKIALVADLVSGLTESSHTFYIANTSTHVTSAGATTGESVTSPTIGTAGKQTMSVGTATLTISKADASPITGIVVAENTVTLAIFRLKATNVEDLDVDQITFSTSYGNYVDTFYFYNGTELLGMMPGADADGDTVLWVLDDDTLIVPANDDVNLTVKAALLDYVSGVRASDKGMIVAIDIEDCVQATGKSSGAGVDSDLGQATGSTMDFYESRPYFSVNSGSPSGEILVPTTATLAAIFDVEADAGQDITFDDDDSNILIIRITAQVNDTESTHGYVQLTLKDEEANILGYASTAFATASGELMSGQTVTFNSTNSFGGAGGEGATVLWRIGAGTSEKLYVYADTLDFDYDGDSMQLWFSATDADCTFGIDLEGAHAEGAIIFRGDVYAGSLINPS